MSPGYSCHAWSGPRPWSHVTHWGAPYVPCPQSTVPSSPHLTAGPDPVWGGLEGGCGVQSSSLTVGPCPMGRGGHKDDNEDRSFFCAWRCRKPGKYRKVLKRFLAEKIWS